MSGKLPGVASATAAPLGVAARPKISADSKEAKKNPGTKSAAVASDTTRSSQVLKKGPAPPTDTKRSIQVSEKCPAPPTDTKSSSQVSKKGPAPPTDTKSDALPGWPRPPPPALPEEIRIAIARKKVQLNPNYLKNKKAELTAALRAFVERHSGDNSQHSAKWYDLMSETVGGSELYAADGQNPHTSFEDVVAAKAGLKVWDGGSPPCWWGTLFEDVAARVVELDCDTEVLGAELCIQAIPHHRDSPDGFCVVGVYLDGEGNLRVCGRGTPPPEDYRIMKIEIKCPYKRKPEGTVPRQYRQQIWSGLEVAPLADCGLFLDCVFRKCALPDLGDTPVYDNSYHRDCLTRGDFTTPVWKAPPFAWGLMFVYAPRPDAPDDVRFVPAEGGAPGEVVDLSLEAWQAKTSYLRYHADNDDADLVDLGDAYFRIFDTVLKFVNRKHFPVTHADPCLARSSGHAGDHAGDHLRSPGAIARALDAARAAAPPHHYLLGVLPWKLLEINYVTQQRKKNFRDEVSRLVTEVFDAVTVVRAAADPAAALEALRAARGGGGRREHGDRGGTGAPATAQDSEELFAILSDPAYGTTK